MNGLSILVGEVRWHPIGAGSTDFPDVELEVLVFDGYLNDVVKASLAIDENDLRVWIEQVTDEPLPDPQWWADVPFPGGK